MTETSIQLSKLAQDIVQFGYPTSKPDAWMPMLRPSLKALRSAYRTDGIVSVDYTKKNTAQAYLLAYAPYHIKQSLETLETLPSSVIKRLSKQSTIELVCVCGGPGPEVIAFQLWLKSHGIHPKILKVHLYDKHANGWNQFANFKQGPQLKDTQIHWHYHAKDMNYVALSHGFGSVDNPFSTADVVMVQNCLNEIDVSSPNNRVLFQGMKSNATLVISDLSRFKRNLYKMHSLRRRLSGSHVVGELSYVNFSTFNYTTDIEQHLFSYESGTKPRRNLRTATIYAIKK